MNVSPCIWGRRYYFPNHKVYVVLNHLCMDSQQTLNNLGMVIFTPWGILFNATGTAQQKAWSPYVFKWQGGCERSCLSAERSFRVDRRAAGDLQYKLGLDHLGICKPAMRSWNRLCDWQGASVMWTVLVLYCWIHAARGPHEQHSSQFPKYDSIVYLWCHTTGGCSSQFWT